MNRLLSFLLFAAAVSAQPAVTRVVNIANTSLKLCPGVEVVVEGSNLGSSGQTVTVNGEQATITENGSGLIVAVLPADLPVGSTTLTVAYNGQSSAPFSITLTAYAPGFVQINSAYIFPTCPQCYSILDTDPPGVSTSSPALPGAEVGGVATGLGALPIGTITVTAGGQPATVVGVQPDGQYEGLYDVLFNVPNGLAAGAQPVTFSIGGVTSPTYTLYVGTAAPSIAAIENSASGTQETMSHAAAPNSIVSVYAYNAGSSTGSPGSYPATTFEGVQVLVNGTAVPIYSIVPAANQINIQLPSELPTSGTATVEISAPNGSSSGFTIALGPADVGIFRLPSSSIPNNGAIGVPGTAWLVAPASVAAYYQLGACSGVSASKPCAQPATPGREYRGLLDRRRPDESDDPDRTSRSQRRKHAGRDRADPHGDHWRDSGCSLVFRNLSRHGGRISDQPDNPHERSGWRPGSVDDLDRKQQ